MSIIVAPRSFMVAIALSASALITGSPSKRSRSTPSFLPLRASLSSTLVKSTPFFAVGSMPTTAAQGHQQYRTYVSTVIIDATGVLAATGNLAACRSDRTECVSTVNQAGQQVSGFQKDLAATPAPACLSATDELLRDGLTFQARGFQLAEQGVKATDRVQVAQSLLLLAAGWWRGGQAVAKATGSSC